MGKRKMKIELTEEEYNQYLLVRQEYTKLLDGMSAEERKQFFNKILFRKPISFEKEIDGTVYHVSTHFNSQAKSSVSNRIARLIEKQGR